MKNTDEGICVLIATTKSNSHLWTFAQAVLGRVWAAIWFIAWVWISREGSPATIRMLPGRLLLIFATSIRKDSSVPVFTCGWFTR